MKRNLIILYGLIFISSQPSESLRCHTTGVSWTNNCTLKANERWKTDPACLSAIILDGKLYLFIFHPCISMFTLQNITTLWKSLNVPDTELVTNFPEDAKICVKSRLLKFVPYATLTIVTIQDVIIVLLN